MNREFLEANAHSLVSSKASSAIAPLLGLATIWSIALGLHLTPALFSALVVMGVTTAWVHRLRGKAGDSTGLRIFILVLMLLLGIVAAYLLTDRIHVASKASNGFDGVLSQIDVALETLPTILPTWIASHLPATRDALQHLAKTVFRENVATVQLWGQHTVRGIGYVLIGGVIGALLSVHPGRPPGEQLPVLAAFTRTRDDLVGSFMSVVFSQVKISLINTCLTAIFLVGIVPLLGPPLPMAPMLLLITFVAGMLPVIGNLISNTVIVLVSLAHAPLIAALALAWLVVIHKLEYFLNAKIVGSRIRASAWEILIVMLIMEAAFGLAGLISAPIIYAHGKKLLFDHGLIE